MLAYISYFIWVYLSLSGSLYVDDTSTTREVLLLEGQYDLEIEFARCSYEEIRLKAPGLEIRQVSRNVVKFEGYECSMLREKVVRVVTVPQTQEYKLEFTGRGGLSYKFTRTDEFYPGQMLDEYMAVYAKMTTLSF